MKRTRQFTLIELLLVIGIMILIMGLTVPSFRRMASGNAVNASARMLAGQLNLARAAAIAEQRYIAIIMPGCKFKKPNPAGESSGNSSDEYHFRSFRVGVVEPTSTPNEFQLVEWYPGANWSFLPVGAVIAEVNDSALSDSRTSGVELFKDGDSGCSKRFRLDVHAVNQVLNGAKHGLSTNPKMKQGLVLVRTDPTTVLRVWNEILRQVRKGYYKRQGAFLPATHFDWPNHFTLTAKPSRLSPPTRT